jgi:hypothetical protein
MLSRDSESAAIDWRRTPGDTAGGVLPLTVFATFVVDVPDDQPHQYVISITGLITDSNNSTYCTLLRRIFTVEELG